VSFGALLDGEQPLGGARPVVNDVELVFVADAYAASFRVAAAAAGGGRRLDQRDDRRLFGDLEFLQNVAQFTVRSSITQFDFLAFRFFASQRPTC